MIESSYCSFCSGHSTIIIGLFYMTNKLSENAPQNDLASYMPLKIEFVKFNEELKYQQRELEPTVLTDHYFRPMTKSLID